MKGFTLAHWIPLQADLNDRIADDKKYYNPMKWLSFSCWMSEAIIAPCYQRKMSDYLLKQQNHQRAWFGMTSDD